MCRSVRASRAIAAFRDCGSVFSCPRQDTTNDIGKSANQMGDYLPAIDVGAGRTVTDFVAGYKHTCVSRQRLLEILIYAKKPCILR